MIPSFRYSFLLVLKLTLRYLLNLFFLGSIILMNAQTIQREAYKDSLKNIPYFTIYKDNYLLQAYLPTKPLLAIPQMPNIKLVLSR